MNKERIPVTIITGFLGAGKTTLLNSLIKKNAGKKLAIIENEFGEINIDSDLVIGADNGIFELSSGCICCELNDELINVLFKLLNSQKQIDHLIVETTGIADPGPVAMSFLSDAKIQSIFRLDAIVTLADAQFIEQQLEDQEEACRQIAVADIVIINKVDKVEPYQKDTVKNIIRRMNSQAQIAESSFSEVAGVDILELKSFSKDGLLQTKFDDQPRKLSERTFSPVEASKKPFSLFAPSTKPNIHSDIASFSFVFPESLDLLRFDIWIRAILNDKSLKLYRVKGILSFRNIDEKLIFQAVNNQYITDSAGLWGQEERSNRIVFIGKNLSREFLQNGLQECCTEEPFEPEKFFRFLTSQNL